ncbi:hypothetical protein PpBr36_04503 [Pyricularia pennisetigena]|nr:hypothetical protein PpBr36_04503 [Pyricularia pennisetigena]TLS26187.1 hypothetical protein PpBr36_04503 [Pyricularia pennisetigena]
MRYDCLFRQPRHPSGGVDNREPSSVTARRIGS